MADITALAQRMKAAAEKAGCEQWQTRKGFSGVEVIVKGSVANGRGCVSYQPVAADLADIKTAKTVALFSPYNVLALVEALEKAQAQSSKWLEAYHKAVSVGARYEERIAELESRTVTVKLRDINEYLADVHDKTLALTFRRLAEGVRAGDIAAMTAAGIQVIEGEG